MSRRFMSINLAKPMETVGQFPFVLCAWPSFADQPYITNYRVYDDRVGETTRFTYRPDHRVVLVPPAEADRGLDAQVLRLGHRRLRLALVLPHRVHRPDRTRRRALPQETSWSAPTSSSEAGGKTRRGRGDDGSRATSLPRLLKTTGPVPRTTSPASWR